MDAMPWEDLCRIPLKKSTMTSPLWLVHRFTHTWKWCKTIVLAVDSLHVNNTQHLNASLSPITYCGSISSHVDCWIGKVKCFRHDGLVYHDVKDRWYCSSWIRKHSLTYFLFSLRPTNAVQISEPRKIGPPPSPPQPRPRRRLIALY